MKYPVADDFSVIIFIRTGLQAASSKQQAASCKLQDKRQLHNFRSCSLQLTANNLQFFNIKDILILL